MSADPHDRLRPRSADPSEQADGGDAPVQVSAQKARQADGNWTPLRVLVFGLALAGVGFAVSYLF